MNVIARLEYELAYYDSAVHRFNHYTTRTQHYKVHIKGKVEQSRERSSALPYTYRISLIVMIILILLGKRLPERKFLKKKCSVKAESVKNFAILYIFNYSEFHAFRQHDHQRSCSTLIFNFILSGGSENLKSERERKR